MHTNDSASIFRNSFAPSLPQQPHANDNFLASQAEKSRESKTSSQGFFCRTFKISHACGWRGVCASTIRDRHRRCAVAPGSAVVYFLESFYLAHDIAAQTKSDAHTTTPRVTPNQYLIGWPPRVTVLAANILRRSPDEKYFFSTIAFTHQYATQTANTMQTKASVLEFIICRTSKMSRDSVWRATCASRMRDRRGRWL